MKTEDLQSRHAGCPKKRYLKKTSQVLRKLPYTSYLESNVNVNFVCPVCPVDHGDLDDHDCHGNHDDHVDHKTSYSRGRKMEMTKREPDSLSGVYLTRWAYNAGSIPLEKKPLMHELITHALTRVGIEQLGQLKINRRFRRMQLSQFDIERHDKES